MSRKKNKKHTVQPKVGKNPEKLQQTSKTKKMNPMARNLLLIDLIILGASQMLLKPETTDPLVINGVAVLGTALLLAALYLEFGPKPGRKGL